MCILSYFISRTVFYFTLLNFYSMITHTYQIRINYSDTDKMGFVHHSNYVKIYENARWEMLRELGIPYSEIEAQGIFMPVIYMDFKFIKSAFYDDVLTVTTTISELPTSRIKFKFELKNEIGELINTANLSCAFIDSKTSRVKRVPQKLHGILEDKLSIKI